MAEGLEDVERVVPDRLHVVEDVDVEHLGFDGVAADAHALHGFLAQALAEGVDLILQLVGGLHV